MPSFFFLLCILTWKKGSRIVISEYRDRFLELEAYCRRHDYSGHCKFDALNSPLLEALFGFSAPTRLLSTQLVNRLPLPLRDLFSVKKYRNPKGVANFIKGYCAYHRSDPDLKWVEAIRILADWLLTHDSKSKGAFLGSGKCWGYQFPWQSPGFYAPRHSPNCIVTTFCADALLAAYEVTKDVRYLEGAKQAKDFILNELPILEEGSDFKCIGYVHSGPRWKVININAVVGGFLAKLAKTIGDPSLMQEASRLIRWTVSARLPDYSWNYTQPKAQSGIGPDNYHTGGILDGILDYMLQSGDDEHRSVYELGLKFYQEKLFTSYFAPKWRVQKPYPHDIHGSAQGILTFVKAANLDPAHRKTAQKIAHWALLEMRDPKESFFYYQKHRHFIWKLNLMRWNNSWMFWALSELIAPSVVNAPSL